MTMIDITEIFLAINSIRKMRKRDHQKVISTNIHRKMKNTKS